MRALTVPAVLLALVVTAGCGGDASDDAKRTTNPRLTETEFVERADALCAQFDLRIDPLERKSLKTADPRGQGRLVNRLARETERLLDSLDRLGTPTSGDTPALKEYLKVSRQQLGLARRTAKALSAGDVNRASRVARSGRETGARLRRIAQGYGFKVCGAERD